MLCCVLEVVGFSWLAVVLSLSPSRCLMVSFVHIESFYIMKTCRNSCEGLRQNALLEVASLFINCEKSFLPVHGAICWFCSLLLHMTQGREEVLCPVSPPETGPGKDQWRWSPGHCSPSSSGAKVCGSATLSSGNTLLSFPWKLPPLLTRCRSSFPAGNIPTLQTKILGQLQPAAVASPVGAFA